jgi:hypothetical protein
MQVEKFLNDRCRNVHIGMLAFLLCIWLLTSMVEARAENRAENRTYLKRNGNDWVEVRKGPEGVTAVSSASPPVFRESRQVDSGLFGRFQAFPVGSWPEAVAVGDVNRDGRNDVIMTTSFYFDPGNDYHLFVFLQNSKGKLRAPIKYRAGNGKSVDIGDLNHDGRADIVVSTKTGIGVLLQNRFGRLRPMVHYNCTHRTEVGMTKIKIGDFNTDGRLDVAAIHFGKEEEEMDIFLQGSQGILEPPIINHVQHGGYDAMEVGDMNHDGQTDIVVMSGQLRDCPNFGVMPQIKPGVFGAPRYYDVQKGKFGRDILRGMALGNVGGSVGTDKLDDVVVAYGGNRPYSRVAVFTQNNKGMLDTPISYRAFQCPETVRVGDVNQDGKGDVIVVNGGWMNVSVYLQSRGKLLPYELYRIPYASHYNLDGMKVADINSDGANDIVIADYNHGLVVLYNNNQEYGNR